MHIALKNTKKKKKPSWDDGGSFLWQYGFLNLHSTNIDVF